MRTHAQRFTILLVALLSLAFVLFPAYAMQGIRDGLSLFTLRVLPSMFPFFFFSRLLTSLGVAEDMGRALKKPVRAWFGAPDVSGYIFCMSLLGGYPVGAKLIADCYETGTLDENGAEATVAFTSTSGPLFVIGTVGSGMFGSAAIGALLLGAHYLGAVLNGLLYRKKRPSFSCRPLPVSAGTQDMLTDALENAIHSTFLVGGWITLFNFGISLLGNLGASHAPLFGTSTPTGELLVGFAAGLVEVTRGTMLIGQSGAPLLSALPLAAALISLGGMSVWMQSLTFLKRAHVKGGYFVLTKVTHALFSGALAAAATAACCALHIPL